MTSAVVLTKNEAKNIKETLASLKFCDEVIVVDDNSIDKTAQIARKMGAKVFVRDMNMDFSAQSNFGMGKAKGEWVLFVDADERVSEALASEISNLQLSTSKAGQAPLISSGSTGFYVRRKDFIWGRWLKYGEVGAFKSLRLVKKGSGKWVRRVHPHFEITGATSMLVNPLLHYPHQDLNEFIVSINRWSTWHALANKEEGKSANLVRILVWPCAHFVKNYLFRLGFLDGIQGFVYALVMSFHSYLSWSKLLLLQKKEL